MKKLTKRACPDCDSESVATERRPDGDSICSDCGYKDRTIEFDTYIEEPPQNVQLLFTPKTKKGLQLNTMAFNVNPRSHYMNKMFGTDVFVEEGYTYRADYEISLVLKRIPNFED